MMNKKYFVTISVLILLLSSCTRKQLYVKYGQAQARFAGYSSSDGVIRIMMDRFGTVYPGIPINDKFIKGEYSVLTAVYKNHPTIFENAVKHHGLPKETTFEKLQETLLESTAAQINDKCKGKKLVFLIHGFNKHPFRPGNSSAYEENRVMRKKITDRYPNQQFQFVEIYWDGLTWVNGCPALIGLNSMRIWSNAQASSANVGLELRRILSQLSATHTYIISHSLGASVATTALFNVDKYNESSFRENYLKKYQDTNFYKTTNQRVSIGLLAPAIPGVNSFDEFYSRTPAVSSKPDNVSVLIGFNRNDRVLRKFKIVKPTTIGSTSLGCIMDEFESTQAIVNVEGRNLFNMENFSYRNDGKKQKAHAFHKYVANENAMDAFLRNLFGE